jgi:glycine/D-amino acid oxidase-like deaminating enzyme
VDEALSLWAATADEARPRGPLPGDAAADVAIIGGGLTGLWTAYYLAKADPALRIVVLEKEAVGFGASGRNGGWCSALFPASAGALEKLHGHDAAVAMRLAMVDTVDEVGRVTAAEGIDCDFLKGGTVSFARGPVQLASAEREAADAAVFGTDDIELWAADRVRATDALGAAFDPACARLHPLKLVRGLALAVERLGVTIHESTTVLGWEPHSVATSRGTVTADTVVVALEGYSATVRQTHRRLLPLYSLMIATEPLPGALWDEIGIEHGQTFADFRHLIVYGQRTADDRIAFGGRGARYHWGSDIRSSYDRDPRVFEHLRRTLVELFPALGEVAISHRWGGPLGVPRDWHASVRLDPTSRVATAGGYVGDGLSTTNLAGRTLRDLILGRSTGLTELPWVGHSSPDWEPEPLRFLGANAGTIAMSLADSEERMSRRPSMIARAMAPLIGH